MKLKPGEMICSECDGEGSHDVLHDPRLLKQCRKCKGKGIVDWVQNVMGVRGIYISPGVYTKEVDCSIFINPKRSE